MDFESDDLRDRYRITGRNVGEWAFAPEIADLAESRLRQLFLGKRCVFFDVNDIAGDGRIPGIVAFVADIKVGGNPARPLDADVTITTDIDNFYTVPLLSLGIFVEPDSDLPSSADAGPDDDIFDEPDRGDDDYGFNDRF